MVIILEEQIQLLSELISIKSVNDPINRIKPSKKDVYKIKSLIDEVTGYKSSIIESDNYYTIYGCIGSNFPVLLFLAHYDVVPVNIDEWRYEPFKLTIVKNKGFGRGAVDDKGNIVAIIYAIKKLLESNFDGTLIFAFTGDEEVGGKNGALKLKNYLIDKKLLPNYVINGDGHGLIPVVRRRNAFTITITIPEEKAEVKGKLIKKFVKAYIYGKETRHSAYFMPGVDRHPLLSLSEYIRYNRDVYVTSLKGAWIKNNVIPSWAQIEAVKVGSGKKYVVDHALTKMLSSLILITRINIVTQHDSDFGVTINPNIYQYKGGYHIFKFDIRAMSKKLDGIEEKLATILEKCGLKNYQIEVAGGSGYLYTSEEADIVKFAIETQKQLSLKSYTCELAGTSDSRFFSPLGIQCIDYGPIGGNVHGPNEYVIISSLYKAEDFYYNVAIKLYKNFSVK